MQDLQKRLLLLLDEPYLAPGYNYIVWDLPMQKAFYSSVYFCFTTESEM